MELLIPDNWLRDFLKTKATPKKIADCLSLCGPSVEKVEGEGNLAVYSIEVTTNRLDSACVYGIAREAAAILPRLGIKVSLSLIKSMSSQSLVSKVDYLDAKVNPDLCSRFAAILIRNVSIKDSPNFIKERLLLSNVRPINNVVDISNYIMLEQGQPVHTFDYDKIEGGKMILRNSKAGEKIITLDGKTFVLSGNDIVIEDGGGRLIDLAGVMGGENSAIDEKSENVLLFVQTYNPVNIRRTSMALNQRTQAAELFEKGLDPELVGMGIRRGIDLFTKLSGGKPEHEILDIYPHPYKPKKVAVEPEFLRQRLGIDIAADEITEILTSLGFETAQKGNKLEISVPSYRANDVTIPEDILEEVARIYGYHKLPSQLMAGKIPDSLPEAPFDFEAKIKNFLKGLGAVEIYTLSLVAKEFVQKGALRLKNPLGKESEYLRTSIMPSLVEAANVNAGEKEPFHLFEMANVYLPRRVPSGTLPEEKMTLAGIFVNSDFRVAKGIVEGLMDELNIEPEYIIEDSNNFLPSRRMVIKAGVKVIGQFGVLEKDLIYYEFDVKTLMEVYKPVSQYTPLPKFPAQIEDITLILPGKTWVGDVLSLIKASDELITDVRLIDIYEKSYTFRIFYQHAGKTLEDTDVEKSRNKILQKLAYYGVVLKNKN